MVKNKFKSRRTLRFIFSFLILLLSAPGGFFTANATVRYVSHSGSNTPPYTTWETAADSIMFAINISVFGDTIYVANGVYEEQVILIPGLALIGAGMDSCVIDTRQLVTPTDFYSVSLFDSCSVSNVRVVVSNSNIGSGFLFDNGEMILKECKIENAWSGISMFNAKASIIQNIITNIDRGIKITNFSSTDKTIITGNIINVASTAILGIGVQIVFVDSVLIENNIIKLNDEWARGYSGGSSDTAKLFNNLVISKNAELGIGSTNLPTLINNNYVEGNYKYGISAGASNKIENNNTVNGDKGISFTSSGSIIRFNNSWNNSDNYFGFTPDSTNLSVDPMIVNEDTTLGELDFHLQMFSPLIDAGDPNILDVDGSRSDIGLFGGPFGEIYSYQDLAPRPPRNLSAVVDSEYITISWNQNTEADFMNYTLYRDTTSNFTADSTTFAANLTDTFYIQIIPGGINTLYYKLTATDNQGNESLPSEELAVIITSVNEYPSIVSNYQLYQNYPNPFNPTTKIAYKLKERGYVKLYVYDVKGELVSTLVNQFQDAGYYEVNFDVKGQTSNVKNQLASGVYIYQLMIKGENNIPVFSDIKKMLMIK